MDTLQELQRWYQSQCNGNWEHGGGITIETLDNPGWRVRVSLLGTKLESKPFREISRLESGQDWIRCWIEDDFFHAAGGPQKLEEILQIFLLWSQSQ